MLKIMVKKWDENKSNLEKKLSTMKMNYQYDDLVKLTFKTIFNNGADASFCSYFELDLDRMTKINNGSYSGTLLYIIPFATYEPDEGEYIMTYVNYGSCCGCDTLERIKMFNDEDDIPNEKQLADLMMLCKDIITNTIKPYNKGYNYREDFEEITEKENG